jgi:3-hydroxyacyl-CoA dehydrogenase
MKRKIRKVAVLGAGVMGAQIACHFANIGLEVLLLDIPPRELTDSEKKENLTLEDPAVKNRIVNQMLDRAIKTKPAPLYLKAFSRRIQTGNFNDDLPLIKDCDWILEAIVENLQIKKDLYDKIEKYRKPKSLVTTNTSGIPIQLLTENRSEDFQKHFCGTHFFNPPRYLKLLEIIPSTKTAPEVIEFIQSYGETYLGKSSIICKDTPAFIANRVGVFSIMSIFHLLQELELTVEEIDRLTGPVIGRPKSATFRTCDVVGLDTLVYVARDLQKHLVHDEAKELFQLPSFIEKMMEHQWLGAKTGQGFYKKIKDESNKSEILSLNLSNFKYQAKQKIKLPELEAAKAMPLKKRFTFLLKGKSKVNLFYQKLFFGLFAYASHRIPEISDELYKIDQALCAGFAWEMGPFEIWNTLGLEKTLPMMEELGIQPAQWVYNLKEKQKGFYLLENGTKKFYDIASEEYQTIPGTETTIQLDNLRATHTLWKNEGCSILDLGDGVLNLEFHSKMNTIGSDIIQGVHKALDMAERDHKALIIANEGENFSAGANVGLIFMLAVEQEFDELDMVVRKFQETMMRIKYAPIPVIAAPHGLTLGGGCELCMHTDKIIAQAETYMGLVELGVGLIPAGGGTKEFALRLSEELKQDDIRTNAFRNRFLTIGQGKVSTSAHEAFELGYMRHYKDEIIVSRNQQLSYAKKVALLMAEKGYTAPIRKKDIRVMGSEGLALIYSGANAMHHGHYISEHDQLISQKLGYVLSGGELSEVGEVSEQYLLNLERKAFVGLCQKTKTLERMQSLLQKGKILRN